VPLDAEVALLEGTSLIQVGEGSSGPINTTRHRAAHEGGGEEVATDREKMNWSNRWITDRKRGEMKHYVGERTGQGCEVMVLDASHAGGGYLLDPRLDLRKHSASEFSWGSSGSRSSQLSLALLADALGDDRKALALYQEFKRRIIAPLEGDHFELSAEDIRQTVARIEAQQGRRL
jgi:Family of unknown function (DUF6166)